jgi:RNA ligase (TIGR02306 family)
MRKLATVRKIDAIHPIPDADAIEVAAVGGWRVVVKKGEYQAGDLAVYCEIDSWIPNELAPFLSKGQEPREHNGIKGERLRTVKLRGQVSQGLLLPTTSWIDNHCEEGDDLTVYFKIQKYEAPIPAQLAGEVRGLFPSFIPKTDQERIQNLTKELSDWKDLSFTWEVTEKLDGSSMTTYVMDDDSGVCSRNLNLKESSTNSLWRVALADSLIDKIKSTNRNLALQGEIIGEGIQGNPYKLKGQQFYLFDIYDIDRGEYLSPSERASLVQELGINHVPIVSSDKNISLDDVQSLLVQAEGKSQLCATTEREGLVFKSNELEASFKAISNKFLLKGGN